MFYFRKTRAIRCGLHQNRPHFPLVWVCGRLNNNDALADSTGNDGDGVFGDKESAGDGGNFFPARHAHFSLCPFVPMSSCCSSIYRQIPRLSSPFEKIFPFFFFRSLFSTGNPADPAGTFPPPGSPFPSRRGEKPVPVNRSFAARKRFLPQGCALRQEWTAFCAEEEA